MSIILLLVYYLIDLHRKTKLVSTGNCDNIRRWIPCTYSDEYTDPSGYKNLTKRWSEKLPYYLEDEDLYTVLL